MPDAQENALQDEIVNSLTQISTEQLEHSHRDIRQVGWLSAGAAMLLILAYTLFGNDVGKTQAAYQILHGVIMLALGYSSYILIKYGEIKKWDTLDWLACYGFALPVLIYLSIQFLTGHSPHLFLALILIAIASACLQLLFYRIMRPVLVKALPLIASTVFALWHGLCGNLTASFVLPAICCTIVWLFYRRTKHIKPVSGKKHIIITIVALLICSILFYQPLVLVYVNLFHGHLAAYSQSLLNADTGIRSSRYGFWKVSVYPEQNMVQFHTGGSGLVPSSTYEGFYFSAADTHIPFQGAEVPMEVYGNTAHWSDGTDNHGTSSRICDNLFWFEAHF